MLTNKEKAYNLSEYQCDLAFLWRAIKICSCCIQLEMNQLQGELSWALGSKGDVLGQGLSQRWCPAGVLSCCSRCSGCTKDSR